ncbi:hypothetical protein [Pseudonocardia parietis]|uniref:ARB-07466-like C-terminal domain-containing protein n=1 Tax=Pseudonocardia parietis TaxID=570936 RepID=A0ABS4W207_9PSEU|nr:hypothetical protein [Pseudonocardia parietis]MBP2370206.1 hypothetical protein [Pseudonocardia parietis]
MVALSAGPVPVVGRPWPAPETPPARPGPVVPTPEAGAAAVAAAALSATGRVRDERQAEQSTEQERAEQEQREQAAERERAQAKQGAADEAAKAEPDPPTTVKPPPAPAPTRNPELQVEPKRSTPVGECPDGLAGTVAHVSRAGHHIAGQLGVPLDLIGGRAPRGNSTSDHPTGHALDFMVDVATGNRLADYVLARRAELGVTYVIWRQRYNDGSGWDLMEDRGSPTANHMDHVHVSFDDSPGSGLSC